MFIRVVKTPIFKEGDNLLKFIKEAVPCLKNKTILVITSKIVALAQKRVVKEDTLSWDDLIKKESQLVIPTQYCYLTIKEGLIMPNAGIDKSNAAGRWILLPKDSFGVAVRLRRRLLKYYRINELGVLITDSRVLPLRKGVTGVALGYAGFQGLRNYIGKKDLFGRRLEMSQTNIADSLAAAAVLLMGEAAEQTPLAVIERAPVEFTNRLSKQELKIKIKDDIYYPLFKRLNL